MISLLGDGGPVRDALVKYELTSKQASMQLRALKRRLADEDDPWIPAGRSAAPQQI